MGIMIPITAIRGVCLHHRTRGAYELKIKERIATIERAPGSRRRKSTRAASDQKAAIERNRGMAGAIDAR
jgi:hypothetical protein